MPAGRPTSYKPSYCADVERMGAEGYSVVEMAAEIGVARATLEASWTAANPEFLEAFTHAKQLSQAWWEKQGRTNLTSERFQASLYSRSMAARFPHDWREKQLIGSDPDNPLPAGFQVNLVKPSE